MAISVLATCGTYLFLENDHGGPLDDLHGDEEATYVCGHRDHRGHEQVTLTYYRPVRGDGP